MDRMDCQLLMITFNTFYYVNFIASKTQSVDKMLYYVSQMRAEDRVALWQEVRTLFVASLFSLTSPSVT